MLVLARGSQEVQNSVRSKQLISTVDRLLVVHTEDGPRRLTPQSSVLPLGDDLERFLVRVVLCVFAHDSGVAEPRDIFLDYIVTRASEDGSDELAEPMFPNLYLGTLPELSHTTRWAAPRSKHHVDSSFQSDCRQFCAALY